jgi:hypothetical protein
LPFGIARITAFGCCYRCIVAATEDGQLYFRKRFFSVGEEDLQTGIIKNEVPKVFGETAKVQ